MCEPTTIALALTAVAAVSQGQQARQQGKFQGKVADFNARQQDNEAVRTRVAGTEAENEQRRATAELLSRQRAQLGASGVELGSGSALQLQQDTQTLGEVDALRIRSNFGERAEQLDLASGLTEAQGDAAVSAGRRKFATSLVSAAGTGIGGAAKAGAFDSAAGTNVGGGAAGAGVSSKWYNQSSAAFTA